MVAVEPHAPAPHANSQTALPQPSIAEALTQLAELKGSGALSDSEFEAAKVQVLSGRPQAVQATQQTPSRCASPGCENERDAPEVSAYCLKHRQARAAF